MRYVHLLAATLVLILGSHVEAQTSKSVPDVVVAPLVIEAGNDALRTVSNSCVDQLVAALKIKGVAVARDPQLTEKNLKSAAAPWAVLGRLGRKDGQFALELQLLEAQSGDEMRMYFNADKDPQGACRSVGKVAERIAAFVAEQKGTKP
jgi:hypothetical protein